MLQRKITELQSKQPDVGKKETRCIGTQTEDVKLPVTDSTTQTKPQIQKSCRTVEIQCDTEISEQVLLPMPCIHHEKELEIPTNETPAAATEQNTVPKTVSPTVPNTLPKTVTEPKTGSEQNTVPKVVTCSEEDMQLPDEAEQPPAAETSEIYSAPLEDESLYNGRVMDITFTRPKETLIIGSSIVRDVKANKLQSTTVRSHSGARVNTIRNKIQEMDLAPYSKIVLQVGGNDISSRRPVRRVIEDYDALITEIRGKTDGRADVFVSGIPPRVDVNVVHLNNALVDLCEAHNVTFIRQLNSFIDSYGYVKLNLYQLDDLHLSNRGTVQLLYYCKRGYFRWRKISRKCWQDTSRGGNFHDTNPFSFIKGYGFYFRVGVIFAEKANTRKTRKLPPRENVHVYSTSIVLYRF